MTKALFKKQMLEVFSWVFMDKKSGKNRDFKGIIGYVILYLFIFGFLGVIFFKVAESLCEPLLNIGFGWLYMALMSLIAIAMGVFGSVFNTYSSLYKAKDNDLLLSMPIPPSSILAARLSGVYAIGLLYELIIMIPTVIVFFINAKVNFLGILFTLLIPFILSVFVLVLSCVLGFAVALVSGKIKNKNFITVVLSLAFIVAYYYVYSKAYAILQSILSNPKVIGNGIKTALYPLYHLGKAAFGNVVSMFIFTGIIAVLFFAVYIVLAKTFTSLATENKGGAKAKYKAKTVKAGNANSALFKKELRRFLGSPTYMLNCGLGLILMPILAVVILIKADMFKEMISAIEPAKEIVYMLAAAAVCMIIPINDITAPSVSLEGKNLWLIKAYPVSAKSVLFAKLKLHCVLSAVPVALLTVAVEIVIKPSLAFAILIPITAVLFILLTALAGLFLNLKTPNLNWTNENVPVKQSMSVMLTLFGGWVVVIAISALYILVNNYINPTVYILLADVLIGVICATLFYWIKTKGAKVFENL